MAKRQQQTPESAIVDGIINVFAALGRLIFKRAPKGLPQATAQQLATHWGEVEAALTQPQGLSWAVSEGDKMLDTAMRALNAKGSTMADRLRTLEPQFPAGLYQDIWHAHKLRNELAHTVGATVSPDEAREATNTFARALRTLGVPL